ncbi:MAG: haloacid dehalogenase [Proteobacteria bacterium]|nr:MAG: haloacid dehalogenase [Pseudomonadota bacterium]
MELLVFDLDGTLLNSQQCISEYTRETLALLRKRNIAYTVATGRTIHAARHAMGDADFPLLHVYNNGVAIWDPASTDYLHHNHLTRHEIEVVLNAFKGKTLTPFVFVLEPDGGHSVYHAPPVNDVCRYYVSLCEAKESIVTKPLSSLPTQAEITNINALGSQEDISAICDAIQDEDHLVVFTGSDMYKDDFHWLDVHHSASSKGGAVETLKEVLGYDRVICFGDSDNDISMFEVADEAYATANALDELKAMSTEVIGHHDEDGVARFLRKYYQL